MARRSAAPTDDASEALLDSLSETATRAPQNATLNRGQAAELLSISVVSLDRLVSDGVIPYVEKGSRGNEE